MICNTFYIFGHCTSLFREFLGKGFWVMPKHALQRRACFTKEGKGMAKRANPYLTAVFQPIIYQEFEVKAFLGHAKSNAKSCFAEEGQSVNTFTYRPYFSPS
jgi:hypothetical protein